MGCNGCGGAGASPVQQLPLQSATSAPTAAAATGQGLEISGATAAEAKAITDTTQFIGSMSASSAPEMQELLALHAKVQVLDDAAFNTKDASGGAAALTQGGTIFLRRSAVDSAASGNVTGRDKLADELVHEGRHEADYLDGVAGRAASGLLQAAGAGADTNQLTFEASMSSEARAYMAQGTFEREQALAEDGNLSKLQASVARRAGFPGLHADGSSTTLLEAARLVAASKMYNPDGRTITYLPNLPSG